MNTYRTNAIIAGVLYITGTVAGMLGLALSQPLLTAQDYLAGVAANPDLLIAAAFCTLLMGLSLAVVPVVVYPVLKRHSEVLAVGYVVFRGAIETVAYLVTATAWLLLPALGELYIRAEAAALPGFRATGALLLQAGEAGSLFSVVFCLGGLMLYVALYRSRLVPRWLSVWGLVALVPYLAADVLAVFALLDSMSSTAILMQMPLAVQEMVLAVWLIAKGFSSSAVARGAARTATNELMSAA